MQSVHYYSDTVGSDSDSGEPRPDSNSNDSSKNSRPINTDAEKSITARGDLEPLNWGLEPLNWGLEPINWGLEPLNRAWNR